MEKREASRALLLYVVDHHWSRLSDDNAHQIIQWLKLQEEEP